MTTKEIISEVRIRINDLEEIIPEALIIEWINQGGYELGKLEILEEIATTLTFPDQPLYRIPDDYLRTERVECQDNKLQYVDLRESDRLEQHAKGIPKFYYIWADSIRLIPIPDGEYALKIYYYRLPRKLTTEEQIPDFPLQYHDMLVLYATYRGLLLKGRFDEATMTSAEWTTKMANIERDRRQQKQLDRFKMVKDYRMYSYSDFGLV